MVQFQSTSCKWVLSQLLVSSPPEVLDSLGTVTDGTIAWDAVIPLNTTLAISVRTGNTPTPDATWSEFTAVQNGDAIGSGFRYVQYQASFTTTDTAVTPILQEVRIPYNTLKQIRHRLPSPHAAQSQGLMYIAM